MTDPIDDFAQLQLHFLDQIQWRYELIRPLVLFEEGTPTQRAQDIHTHPDTVRTFTRRFRQQGMLGLFPPNVEVITRPRARQVPEVVLQELARLKGLSSGFQYRELRRIVLCKRSMFGRAKLDRLRRRFLLAVASLLQGCRQGHLVYATMGCHNHQQRARPQIWAVLSLQRIRRHASGADL